MAWRGMGRAPWKPSSFSFWGARAPQASLSSTLSATETLTQIRESLESHGYVSRDVAGTPNPNLVASHHPFALLARPIFNGALLLALAGLAVASYWGWQNQNWIPVPGESRAVGHGTPYTVRLDTLERPQGDDTRLCDFASQITWLEGEHEITSDVASVGQPATLQGIAVRQIGLLPVATVRGQDNAGRPLSFQAEEGELGTTAEIKVEFPVPGDQRPVRIAGHDLYLVLTFEQGGARDSSALHAALLSGKDKVQLSDAEYQLLATPHKSGTLSLDSLEIRADLEFHPILRVDHHPAMPLVLGGLVAALIALFVGWLSAPHLVWIATKPESETSATILLLGLPGDRGSRYLPRLVAHLQEGFNRDA